MALDDINEDVSIGGGTTNFGAAVKVKRRKVTPQDMADMFPDVKAGMRPCGTRILVQLRTVRAKTKGGILVPETIRDDDRRGVAYGKLISKGAMAFCDATTGNPLPSDYRIGEYIRVPKWGGDRIEVDGIDFVFINWWDVISVVEDVSVIP